MNIELHVVLVRPIYARNIGMCARALTNMGTGHLHVIGTPRPVEDLELRQGAAGAQEILNSTRWYSSLSHFHEHQGNGVRIALSARDSRLRDPELLPDTLNRISELQQVQKTPPNALPIYLYFGPEDDGLSFSDMELCHHVCKLPTFSEFTSLNLSHAVLLTCYLVRQNFSSETLETYPTSDRWKREPWTAEDDSEDRRVYYPHETIRLWLESIGFDLSATRMNVEKVFNRIVLASTPTHNELRILESVLRQNIRKLKKGASLRDAPDQQELNR